MLKRYGSDKTHLHLSPIAQLQYNDTDPLAIYEHESNDGEYLYEIRGVAYYYGLTEAEVNEFLETLFYECEVVVNKDIIKDAINEVFYNLQKVRGIVDGGVTIDEDNEIDGVIDTMYETIIRIVYAQKERGQ